MVFAQWSKETAQAVLASTIDKPGPVLLSLQAIQENFGFVPEAAIPLIALACNVSRAEVHGVFTYYHDFRSTPPPENMIRVCVAEACQAVGSRELVDQVEKKFGTKIGEHNLNVEIHSEYCLGNCALGPAARVNGELVGFSTVEKIGQLLKSGTES
ncbi:MAG: NAD(P)H-dependent oxidoreductase subunit E [Actinomycetota bacterium]